MKHQELTQDFQKELNDYLSGKSNRSKDWILLYSKVYSNSIKYDMLSDMQKNIKRAERREKIQTFFTICGMLILWAIVTFGLIYIGNLLS